MLAGCLSGCWVAGRLELVAVSAAGFVIGTVVDPLDWASTCWGTVVLVCRFADFASGCCLAVELEVVLAASL